VTSGAKVLLALALATGTAGAQSVPSNPAADKALAEGRRLYELQEWDRAIAKFKEAYALRDDAASLFNIAQAYRLKGECANAAHFYRTFKRRFPNEKTIDKVEKFLVQMEACAKAAPAAPTTTEPGVTAPTTTEPAPTNTTPVTTAEPTPTTATPGPTVEPVTNEPVRSADGAPQSGPTPVAPPRGGAMRMAGLVVAGVGVAALGGGVYFGLRARDATRDAEALGPGDTWMPGIENRGHSAETATKILLIGGGVTVAAGTLLYILGGRRAAESTTVGVVPSGDGASLVWTGGF
jgi:hypothetical protein